MINKSSIVLLAGLLAACVQSYGKLAEPRIAAASVPEPSASCVGTTALPPAVAGSFEAVDDPALLTKSLGTENKGSLCQGQAYRSKAGAQVLLYRAWNSTNPGSQLGHWWAFDRPEGSVAAYRKNYEICYQWSPLDALVQCSLKPGTKLIVGNGQSAQCSAYLAYPASATQQVYIDDAVSALSDCVSYQGVFEWR